MRARRPRSLSRHSRAEDDCIGHPGWETLASKHRRDICAKFHEAADKALLEEFIGSETKCAVSLGAREQWPGVGEFVEHAFQVTHRQPDPVLENAIRQPFRKGLLADTNWRLVGHGLWRL
jgi:hypothetical protein